MIPAEIKRSRVITPTLSWDRGVARYRNVGTGRFVAWTKVRTDIDRYLDGSGKTLSAIAERLQLGITEPAEFVAEMSSELRLIHAAAAASAKGGWEQMTPATFGQLGADIRRQYFYLRGWGSDLVSGQAPLDGRLLVRAQMYGQAARGTFEDVRRADQLAVGMREERLVRHASDSCPDCVADASRGFLPLHTLRPIGSRQCKSLCKCTFDYRAGASEDVAA